MPFRARSAVLHEIGAELRAVFWLRDRRSREPRDGGECRRPSAGSAPPRGDREAGATSLVLYTLGGDTNTPWPFVNFLRAYCDRLFVLVPFWAHSAGTLIALGADKIYMTRFGTLSPVDPSVTNEFNPHDPASPLDRIPIAVEDVLAFFQLAPSRAGTTRTSPATRSGSSPNPCTRSRSEM